MEPRELRPTLLLVILQSEKLTWLPLGCLCARARPWSDKHLVPCGDAARGCSYLSVRFHRDELCRLRGAACLAEGSVLLNNAVPCSRKQRVHGLGRLNSRSEFPV